MEPEPLTPGETTLAVIAVTIASVLLVIGADLLSGQRISRWVTARLGAPTDSEIAAFMAGAST